MHLLNFTRDDACRTKRKSKFVHVFQNYSHGCKIKKHNGEVNVDVIWSCLKHPERVTSMQQGIGCHFKECRISYDTLHISLFILCSWPSRLLFEMAAIVLHICRSFLLTCRRITYTTTRTACDGRWTNRLCFICLHRGPMLQKRNKTKRVLSLQYLTPRNAQQHHLWGGTGRPVQ